MEEERHLDVRFAPAWIADDQSTEQSEINVLVDVSIVIVERPRADGLLGHVERVHHSSPGQIASLRRP